jgi:hypothetical protein
LDETLHKIGVAGLMEGEEIVTINIPAVETWNITQLRYTCKKNKVKGYTKMKKPQLIEEVKKVIANLKGEE